MDKVVLLADPKTNAWDFAEKIQGYIQKRYSKEIPLQKISIGKFRNGELKLHVPENVRRKEVYFIQDSSLEPQDWLTKLIFIKGLLLRASAEEVAYVLPDLLYSRQDRKDTPHTTISAKDVADSISLGLNRLITTDLHADQIQGFYPPTCRVDSLHSFPIVVNYIQEHSLGSLKELVLVSPDAGGVSRVKAFQKKLGVSNPFAIIDKDRPKAGEIGEMNLVGDINGYNALIVDDIIDSGNTLCSAAKLLKAKGAKKVYCYATHGIFTNGTKCLCDCFDRLMVSNTHPFKTSLDSKIEIIDMSPLFAEAIYRAHTGNSISELYDLEYNWNIK